MPKSYHAGACSRAVFSIRSAVALCILSACGDQAPAARAARTAARATAGSEPVLAPYRVVRERLGGAVAGSVDVRGDVPGDSVLTAPLDENVCGARVTIAGVQRSGSHLGEVVVWLSDARQGKALPLTRRYVIEHQQCRIDPRVQAALAGGTLNVRNADPVVHRTRFMRANTDSTIDLVSQSDAGQVVPNELVLVRPQLLEVRCDVHPWTRAWIRVFDHPYFAVTERDGAFTLDSVPPGRYTLMAWHYRLGTREQHVLVEEGAPTRVEITF